MLQGSMSSVVTAIALGGALGFVMQRGRFCLNSAFRDVIFVKDYTMFRAYLLCVVVAIIGSNFLETMGWLSGVNAQSQQTVVYGLLRQNFVPVANIVGGFIFGLGIVLAGGCASGIVYRLGEGQVSALIATFGFFFGIVMTQTGMISPAHKFLSGLKMSVGGVSNPALWDFFGGGITAKWVTIAVFCTAALVFVFKGKPTFGKSGKGYSWGLTGLLLGLLTASAWWVSSRYGGMPRGLAITTPLREAFSSLLFNHSYSPFPEFSFFGIFNGTWGVFFIFAVPLGAYVSALGLKEFKLKTPPAKEALTVFFGSVLMGIGAVIAGGCNLGHGVTGMSTMAVSSLVAICSIILGNWTMVYFKFIKPMEEMD